MLWPREILPTSGVVSHTEGLIIIITVVSQLADADTNVAVGVRRCLALCQQETQ